MERKIFDCKFNLLNLVLNLTQPTLAKLAQFNLFPILDYDLALRDERMLGCLTKLPRSTRNCLRNYLTKRYPPVPVVNQTQIMKNPNIGKTVLENGNSDLLDLDDMSYIGKLNLL